MINSEIGYFFLFLYMLQLIFFISGNFCFPFVFLTMFANKVKTRRKNKNYTRDQKLATRNLARSISIIVQFQKISIPPMKGTFTLDPPPHPPEFPLYTVEGACHSPPTPWNFHYALQGGACHNPHPPGISIMHCRGCLLQPLSPWNLHRFSTWLGTLWKVYPCQTYCCTLLLSAKDNISEIRCLIISRTFQLNN